MIYGLRQPSESLSRKILSPVPFKERFPAGRLKPPVGIIGGDVRSLAELHLFLEPDEATLPGLDLQSLPDWISRSIGDRELAESVRAAVVAQNNYVEGCQRVHEVVGRRLNQARMVLKEARG
jgi:hypothetical protein